MPEIIDLSQEIYSGMPTYKGLPEVQIGVYATHEQWAGEPEAHWKTPSVNLLSLGEHTGTHVDALNHMRPEDQGKSIDTMPLTTFYTEGICLDLSHKKLQELIEAKELLQACKAAGVHMKAGDTVLLYTDHYRNHFGKESWNKQPGLSADATHWLADQGIAAFGVESMAPGVSGLSNKDVHRICGERGFTHYENLLNLHLLIGRGRFRFIGLPLKIRGGTGSPVRAIAVFD